MKKLLSSWWFWLVVLLVLGWLAWTGKLNTWALRAKLKLLGPKANPYVAPGQPGGAPAQTGDTMYEGNGVPPDGGSAPSAPYLGPTYY